MPSTRRWLPPGWGPCPSPRHPAERLVLSGRGFLACWDLAFLLGAGPNQPEPASAPRLLFFHPGGRGPGEGLVLPSGFSLARTRPCGPAGRAGLRAGHCSGTLVSTGTISFPAWRSPASPLGSSGRAEDRPADGDAEGVWGPDIEQSFQEALAIYPPCGRRKVILSEEGRMYGRNELIARYIRLRTGKTRTRKQVSSHIQVLARRRARELQAALKFWQGAQPDEDGTAEEVKPFSQHAGPDQQLPPPGLKAHGASASWPPVPPWLDRGVGSARLWMLEFSVFLEQWQDLSKPRRHLLVHLGPPDPEEPTLEAVDAGQVYDKFPDKAGGLRELLQRGPADAFFLVKFWADLNTDLEDEDEDSAFYGVTTLLESQENMVVTCSTKVCSFGKQVVEKVETEAASPEASGRYSYRVLRSPLCGYLVSFVHRLRGLPERHQRNSVLDNFTVLQVVTNRDTEETLLCVAFVFEVAGSGRGAQHHVFRLLKD